ncbi:MAG: glycosyltransferase family 39 protein [bacterium]|nr:glycosyltransferase family 39 protein [bacterium]
MYKILLFIILVISFGVRLYHFNYPMADLHSWRQADTASVARNLVRSNFDILHPQIESAVSIDGIGRDNTPRYHFAEFPIYQAAVAAVSYPISQIRQASLTQNIVTSGRIVSIICSLLSIWALYLLCKRYYSENTTILAAFVYGVLPFNIFWSRAILPDSMMVMFSLFLLYFFDIWIRGFDKNNQKRHLDLNIWFIASAVFFALALLLKAFVPFLLLPMAYLLFKRFGFSFIKLPQFWIFALFAVLPFVLWRFWMQTWPYSIPASGWLFDGNHIRFKPAWWHWIVQIRLDQFMFNVTGVFFIGLGLLFYRETFKKSEYIWYLPLCLIACLIYLVVFATGNVQHEYYQLPVTAFGSIFVSIGFWYMWDKVGSWWEMSITRLIALSLILITLLLGWYSVKGWYLIGNPSLVIVGERADKVLPPNAHVIADYGGDTTFLYYVNRKGWSVRDKQLQEIIDRGATHYISMHRGDYMNLLATLYEIVDETPEYVILDLTRQKGDWSNIQKYEL